MGMGVSFDDSIFSLSLFQSGGISRMEKARGKR
jgi:hypothetical protein